MHNFKDQIIVVTGGTRGIGRGITQAFLDAGAKVIATYVSNEKMALDFKNQAENLTVKKCDVKDESAIMNLFLDIEKEFGSVHVLINNSGIRKDNLTASMQLHDWNEVINTNLTGTFLMSKHAVLLMMKSRYGRIVNISSIGGSLGLPGQANYAASKAGQIAISKTLSKEVAKRGITVNNVCPGFIDTELIADLPEEQKKEYMKEVPMKRFGKVEEVASAVLFLASKEASYITGASLEITGGL